MAKIQSPSSVTFKVNRLPPELVAPARPTPHEFKLLSDLDCCLRKQVPVLYICPHKPSMDGIDLVKLIKNAISQALVYYYPVAGRLREDPSGKLVVECTGEGVLFVEADADVTLDQFGYPLAPPFTSYNELIFNVPGSSDILNCPLVLFQMTRLKCGGLIIGVQHGHCMCDAAGFVQFMSAIAEIVKGETSLSMLPTWERHILNSTSSKSFSKNRYNLLIDIKDSYCRTLFFGHTEISALHRHIPHSFQRFSSFEILISCVWKCRVVALASHPDEEEIVSLIWPINLRKKPNLLKVPDGYYGNALMYAVAKSSVKDIIQNPLAHTLQLVTDGKELITENFDQNVFCLRAKMKNYMISDLRNVEHQEIDFGWGKPEYGGPARSLPNTGCLLPFTHKNEGKGLIFPICLQPKSMEIFEKELSKILKGHARL